MDPLYLSSLLYLPDLALLVGVHGRVGGAGEVPGELGHVGERPAHPVSIIHVMRRNLFLHFPPKKQISVTNLSFMSVSKLMLISVCINIF